MTQKFTDHLLQADFFRLLTISFLILCGGNVFSQDDTLKQRLFPKGEPILKVFANFHTGIGGDNDALAFELERAYLGYKMDLSDHFAIKINLDVGSPDDLSEFSKIRRYAYFKNACLTYKSKWLKVDFGLIDMMHYKLQEDFWSRRYIEKSFADRFRFGPSADLGVDAVITIFSKLKADITFSNGEGYSNLQRDNTIKAGFGLQSEPVEGLFLRIYGDVMTKEVTQGTAAVFAGYKFRKIFTVAGEYNWKLNEDYNEDYNRGGYSFYGSYFLPWNLELFARYDFVKSNIPDEEDRPWDIAQDGSSIIGGIQYQPIRQVRIALSYRDWYPYAENLENQTYIYLNLEFKY